MNVFTKEEATSKVGNKVRAKMFVHGRRDIPPNTIGKLVEADSFQGVWMVSVEWVLQREIPSMTGLRKMNMKDSWRRYDCSCEKKERRDGKSLSQNYVR